MNQIILILVSLFIRVNCKDVCYDGLGCFTDSAPFSGSLQRPFALLPENPDKISVKFYLFNKRLGVSNELISHTSLGQYFDPSLKTKIIIHGFLHKGLNKWVADMIDAILKNDNVNIIGVDWSKGNGLPYTQATANTQVVGAEIARLVNALIRDKGVRASDFHMIGHSLGAHTAGYAGERIQGLGRITGLDPAGLYFENTDTKVRLDPSDAVFVEAIHTDGTANLLLGLGLMQPLGHADYYPNGGKNQPDCTAIPNKLIEIIFSSVSSLEIPEIDSSIACSHQAAVYYYIDSIKSKSCKYTAYPCGSKDDFEKGNCLKCTKGCNRMGYFSTSTNDIGQLYLNTQTPYNLEKMCKQNHLTTFVSSSKDESNLVQARGKFTIYFETVSEVSSIEIFDETDATFKPDSIETRLITLTQPLVNPVLNVYVYYKKTSNFITGWMYDDKWSFKYIQVLNGDDQTTSKFCPTTNPIFTEQTVKFRKC